MTILHIKQGDVKLSQMLMKTTHRPHRLPQQTHIGAAILQVSCEYVTKTLHNRN